MGSPPPTRFYLVGQLTTCSRSVSGLLLFIFLSMAFTPQLPALLPTTTPFYLLCNMEGLGLLFWSVLYSYNWRSQQLVLLKMKVNSFLFEYVCLWSNSPCKHRLCRHCSHFSWLLTCLFFINVLLCHQATPPADKPAQIFFASATICSLPRTWPSDQGWRVYVYVCRPKIPPRYNG